VLTVLGYSDNFVASTAADFIVVGTKTSVSVLPSLYDGSSLTTITIDYWANGDYALCYAKRYSDELF